MSLQQVLKAIRDFEQKPIDDARALAVAFAPLVTQTTGAAAPGPGSLQFETAVLNYCAANTQTSLADVGITGAEAGDWFRDRKNNWHGHSNFTTADETARTAIRDNRHPSLSDHFKCRVKICRVWWIFSHVLTASRQSPRHGSKIFAHLRIVV